jgi:hypothetical protein
LEQAAIVANLQSMVSPAFCQQYAPFPVWLLEAANAVPPNAKPMTTALVPRVFIHMSISPR